ncbi:M23 family metallopeptidase [Pseudonocardia alaniniphila]|uniref:M23 family metallopeptidase n=1 Tax=Pseudonocardia alaniniphila TaxID=75291 RepID=A0ABS9TUX8_9PSEU|nr:M23 family metallopeptidase [Pseudonocardia alaniniphila]MCH6172362.1 M23 family metallopeptidase [Pseudonocardia alaniniphila]
MPLHIRALTTRFAVTATATAAAALVGFLPAFNGATAPAKAPAPAVPVPNPPTAQLSAPPVALFMPRTSVSFASKIVDTRAGAADAKPRAAARGSVQMVTGRVTSGFGRRWGSFHQGLDIAAPIGTPIHAPLAGTVISSGPARGFGLWVRVRHTDGTITVYGHINRSLVRVGQRVSAGQEIAEVGNRGQATGPHLHIEVVTPGGVKINPQPWLNQHRIVY